ncbi:HNH endonuclease [Streptomyces sp. NRRL F-5126]|uniref:HNH endonuclease n=1 Tax=Streptomyces sp. NRRL F-5126 TaxID=1463857 RepID=UPI002D2186F1|nr:HNH endonuclease [Streptomyces sp. NRRL F-5126]
MLSSAAAGRTPGEALRRWLLLSGRPETCAMCGTAGEWNGRPLRLQVDHRDGHWWDNRPENLRLLCPNCHAVTDTFRGRRRSGSTERRPPLARAALAEAVSDAGSMVELLRILRVPDSEAARARVRRDIATHGLDASHFAGQGTHRGRSRARLSAKAILSPSRPGTPRRKTYMLRRALSELGVEAVCVMCGLGDRWRGRRLVLEIDHINGDRLDNRIENLRYLCPSCHTQTVTYGGNKTPRRSKAAVAPQHRPARRRAAAPAVPRPRKPEPTEEERAELKAAVADSAGWADLVRRLGLRASTGRRRTLQKRVADLGLDTSHFKQRSAWRTYADDSIAEAVASSESMREVIDKLCVRISVGALAHIARRIEAMGIDTSHLADLRDGAQELPFTREELRSVADSRRSVREVARRLGISDDTRSRKALGRMLEKHGLAP